MKEKTEYSNGSSQNLGEKQVLGSRDENVILNEKSITLFDDEHAHSKQVRQDAKLLDTTNSVLKDQLYSSHLLRSWRTGAANFSYSADEDDFDVSKRQIPFLILTLHLSYSPQFCISMKVSLH